jgi:hypothetical protein
VGDRIGVSGYRNLQGLHRYVGRRVELRYSGDKELRTGVAMKMFDVEVADEDLAPPRIQTIAADSDSDVPF